MERRPPHAFCWLMGLLLAALPGFPAPVLAQERMVISSSPTPVGSGARAAGMANAFIAVADDATAASWNPAGLVQLERPEVSGVGSFRSRSDEFHTPSGPNVYAPDTRLEVSAGRDITNSPDLNFLSVAIPFHWLSRNFTASVSYQQKFDFNRSFDGNQKATTSSGPDTFEIHEDFRLEQRGGLAAISPAIAVQITPYLSFGTAMNVWVPELFMTEGAAWMAERWQTGTLTSSIPEFPTVGMSRYEKDTFSDFTGINATVGLLAQAGSRVSFGAVAHIPFRGRAKFHRFHLDELAAGDDPASFSHFHDRISMDFPWSYGAGVAYRVNDRLCFSFDWMRVQWGDFMLRLSSGKEYSPITGKSREDPTFRRPRSTDTFRLGSEYLFIKERFVVPLRAGFFYDPQPRGGAPDDYFGICAGSALILKNVTVDLAYQYRFGNRVAPTVSFILGNLPGAQEDVREHLVLFSTVYRFAGRL